MIYLVHRVVFEVDSKFNRMSRFLSEIQGKYTKLAKIVKSKQ